MTHIIDGSVIDDSNPLAIDTPGNMEADIETMRSAIMSMQSDLAAMAADIAALRAGVIVSPWPVTAQYRIDEDAEGIVSIDTVHNAIHEGRMFTAEYSASVNNNLYLDMLFTTGVLEQHIAFGIGAGGQCLVTLYEAPPNVTGGTAVTSYNMNRNSPNTSIVTVTHTPNIVDAGTTTLINGRLLPGGTSVQTRIGNTARSGTEFELKKSTKYLLRVQNTSGGAIVINVVAEYYHP